MSEGAIRSFWKQHKAAIQIGLFVAAIAVAVAVPFVQAPLCSIPTGNGNAPTYRITVNSQHGEENAGTRTDPGISKFSFDPSVNGAIEEKQSAEASYYSPQEKVDWGRQYWCDVKASDYFLVLFTLFLAISTYFLWRETERLAKGAESQAEDTRKALKISKRAADAAVDANRPWLKISAEINGPLIFKPRVTLGAAITIENVGRSPATRVKVSTGIGVMGATVPRENRVDAVRAAVNKAQISQSERIVFNQPRTLEELAIVQTIGDVVFPNETRHDFPKTDWPVSLEELKFALTGSRNDSPLVFVCYAVSAEYRFGSTWGVTTVVYAVENFRSSDESIPFHERVAFRRLDSTTMEMSADQIILRKLPIHTTAT